MLQVTKLSEDDLYIAQDGIYATVRGMLQKMTLRGEKYGYVWYRM